MSGKRSKAIRRVVLGEGYSIKARKWKRLYSYGQIICDPRRQRYQRAKKAWSALPSSQK